MVGILLVTHLDFGQKMLEAAELIMGEQDNCLAIAIGTNKEMEVILEEIRRAVTQLDTGEGVLIFTDMFGGTPSNLSLSLLGSAKLEVMSGVNLPMLLKAFSTRHLSLEDMATAVREAGQEGIVVAGEFFKTKIVNG